MCVCVCVCVCVCACVHTYIHAYIHIHTYIQIRAKLASANHCGRFSLSGVRAGVRASEGPCVSSASGSLSAL